MLKYILIILLLYCRNFNVKSGLRNFEDGHFKTDSSTLVTVILVCVSYIFGVKKHVRLLVALGVIHEQLMLIVGLSKFYSLGESFEFYV